MTVMPTAYGGVLKVPVPAFFDGTKELDTICQGLLKKKSLANGSRFLATIKAERL